MTSFVMGIFTLAVIIMVCLTIYNFITTKNLIEKIKNIKTLEEELKKMLNNLVTKVNERINNLEQDIENSLTKVNERINNSEQDIVMYKQDIVMYKQDIENILVNLEKIK